MYFTHSLRFYPIYNFSLYEKFTTVKQIGVVCLQRAQAWNRSDKLGRMLYASTNAEKLKIPQITGLVDIFMGFSATIC